MRPFARSITQELLTHHRLKCRVGLDVNACIITYGDLCDQAGCLELVHVVGDFLQETAEWCVDRGWPPINALAVNADSRMPGDGYDRAPRCSLLGWHDEVRRCIDFCGYPVRVE